MIRAYREIWDRKDEKTLFSLKMKMSWYGDKLWRWLRKLIVVLRRVLGRFGKRDSIWSLLI